MTLQPLYRVQVLIGAWGTTSAQVVCISTQAAEMGLKLRARDVDVMGMPGSFKAAKYIWWVPTTTRALLTNTGDTTGTCSVLFCMPTTGTED